MPNGGARPGAGRKPKPVRAVKKVLAEAILATVDEIQRWTELLNAERTIVCGEGTVSVPDNDLRLKALIYLTNRRDGTPPQSLQITGEDGGPIEHNIRFISAHEKTDS